MSNLYMRLKPQKELTAIIKQRLELGIKTFDSNGCPRCGGRLTFEPDPDFDYCASCLMCGYVTYHNYTEYHSEEPGDTGQLSDLVTS